MNLKIGNIVDVAILLLEGVAAQTATPLDDLGVLALKMQLANSRKSTEHPSPRPKLTASESSKLSNVRGTVLDSRTRNSRPQLRTRL